METFDLTPDPKVLVALTRTPLAPLDALCELIDNGLDSFRTAKLQGSPILHPIIVVELPRIAQLDRGEGVVRVQDNGTGLTSEMAEKALKAGYSGNNPYDNLGLFGMGFNIATGKLGRKTRFLTAMQGTTHAIIVTVDLEEITRTKSYKVPVEMAPKPAGFINGTCIEISGWWPDGDANSGFVKKLVKYGIPGICEGLGRRYAAILKAEGLHLSVNGQKVIPFEHCAWSDKRFVERRDHGKIPAVFRFNEVLSAQPRCSMCTAIVEAGSPCPACGATLVRTVEERVSGWVGIQRYDDSTEFGIDLIRNGRAIRIAEKSAFFDFVDEFKKTIKDYPIDGTYGRIIGEINLNHVPVDFMKQDFQRSSPEWQRAISYLRGDSSLQPNQPGADSNSSPVYKLYQGYRKVRNVGPGDMYMGFWDDAEGKAKRISRDKEKELLEKFGKRLPGFFDDAEWWKLVEEAVQRPLVKISECPECLAQNLEDAEACSLCGHILIPKPCLNPECSNLLPMSAVSCPVCATDQVPEIKKKWVCKVCAHPNQPDALTCASCSEPFGKGHPLDPAQLLLHAAKIDELSINDCQIKLPDGSLSDVVQVAVYGVDHPLVDLSGTVLPQLPDKSPGKIDIFLNLGHPLFKVLGVKPHILVASEIAQYIFTVHQSSGSASSKASTISNYIWLILDKCWGEALSEGPETIKAELLALFEDLANFSTEHLKDAAEDIHSRLDKAAQHLLLQEIQDKGQDPFAILSDPKEGRFLQYLPPGELARLVEDYPGRFLDKHVWDQTYTAIGSIDPELAEAHLERIRMAYVRSLQDAAWFLAQKHPDAAEIGRAKAALVHLLAKRV